MEIKTAEEILAKHKKEVFLIPKNERVKDMTIIRAMKEYTTQFIDLAAEVATVEEHYPNVYSERPVYAINHIVDKESILKIKELIK